MAGISAYDPNDLSTIYKNIRSHQALTFEHLYKSQGSVKNNDVVTHVKLVSAYTPAHNTDQSITNLPIAYFTSAYFSVNPSSTGGKRRKRKTLKKKTRKTRKTRR